MKTSIKTSLSTKKTLLILSVICVTLGLVCCILGGLGEFLLPIVIANLAAIYLFDKKRSFAFIVSGILMAFNLAGVLIGINISFFSLAAIVTALILAGAYARGQSKSDAAFLSTIVYSLLTVGGMLLLGMIASKNFTLDASVNYWVDMYKSLYDVFVGGIENLLQMLGEIYKESDIAYLREVLYLSLDIYFICIISYLVIGAFAVIGFSMKAFGFIVKKCAEDNTEIVKWRFATSSIYAYFYLALSLATVFVSSTDNIFAIAVFNLYYIFMAVYAYVGFKGAVELLKKKLHPALAYLIVIGVLIIMMRFALSLLALIGVLYTFSINRKLPSKND